MPCAAWAYTTVRPAEAVPPPVDAAVCVREDGGMHAQRKLLTLSLSVLLLLAAAVPVSASHEDRPSTKNLHPIGHIEEPRSGTALFNPAAPGDPNIHTDLAFWGNYAFQGTWLGFNVRDISAPGNPKQVSFTPCEGGQGDVVVWDDVLVRSWDGGAFSGAPPGRTCGVDEDGEPIPVDEGFAGLHIFDISDLTAPELVGEVELSGRPEADSPGCGSHTATGVPDLDNNRLLIYNGPSTAACPWIEVIEVPLDDPGEAAFVRQVDTGRPCHDNGVILGDAMLAACAGGNGFTVLELDPDALDDPQVLHSIDVNEVIEEEELEDGGEVSVGHSTAFSWDGEVLIFGHEPGGGVEARCQEDTPDTEKSAFFFEPRSGDFLGMWTLPRPQTANENCTFHNFNVVPLRSGDRVFVHGSYQSGTGVVDFNDPANAVEIAWSDPPPIPVPENPIFCLPEGCELGGAWASYWYNNFIYETSIDEGLNIFRFSGRETAGAMRLPHLNPQTQEFTIP